MRQRGGLWTLVGLLACTGGCSGPLYAPPCNPAKQAAEVHQACLDFRKEVEHSSGTWSWLAYSLAAGGTIFVAGGSAGAAASNDTTLRAFAAMAAAFGALAVATSKGAFESSWAMSSAAASIDQALKNTDPATMNELCLQADANLRLAKRNEISASTTQTQTENGAPSASSDKAQPSK